MRRCCQWEAQGDHLRPKRNPCREENKKTGARISRGGGWGGTSGSNETRTWEAPGQQWEKWAGVGQAMEWPEQEVRHRIASLTNGVESKKVPAYDPLSR